ncbi:MAG: metal ABC transporter substrate-binding protein [Vulcanimicrobiota bacterium]
MKQCPLNRKVFIFICLIAVTAVMISSCAKKADRGKSVNVVVSILPLADLVKHVGGEYVTVETIVPLNTSPHVFEPSPRELKLVSKADLMVINGLGLEFWKDKMVEASANPQLRILDLSQGVECIMGDEEHDAGHHNKDHYGNPHIWLSPRIVSSQVDSIRRALTEIDKAHAGIYEKNASLYRLELEALDKEIRDKVKKFKEKRFVSHHAAWVYFARDYGLEQVGAIETTPGKEPTPVEIQNLLSLLKRINAKAVFTEPQFSPKAAEVIAEECGIKVLTLNYMGIPPEYNYIDMMRYNIKEMEKALK